MDTLAFLAKVTPSAGNKILAERVNRGKYSGWTHHVFNNTEDMARHALELDEAGGTIYFAVNGYGDWYEVEENGSAKRRIRTQANVVSCRSLYDDIDTGKPGTYAGPRQALQAVLEAIHAGLPKPMIVFSGGGLHLYWPLEQDVTPAQWTELATIKRSVMSRLNLLVDPAVDTDSARVLRPVGTTNRKREPAQTVKLLQDVAPYNVDELRDRLLKLGGMPAAPQFFGMQMSNDLGVKTEYPPSSAERIVKACAALAEIVDNPRTTSEPQWRAMLGLVKHTTEGRSIAHQWSRGHPGYSASDTDGKYDLWSAGPSTCAEFSKHTDACTDCPYNGRVKSPIFLGYAEDAPAPPQEQLEFTDETPQAAAAPAQTKYMPKGFGVVNGRMCKAVKDENGIVNWTAFCIAEFEPTMRVRLETGEWGIEVHMRVGDVEDNTFRIPIKAISSADNLASAMAANEVLFVGNNGKRYAMEYMTEYISHLQHAGTKTITFNEFGWTPDFTGFVVGDRLITADGEAEVLNGDKITGTDMEGGLGITGTAEEWARRVDHIYNRAGAEPMQFAICAAFGSPLVKLMGSDNWHGIPIALSGHGGLGKTTVCQVACSIYGNPRKLQIAANRSGTTGNGLYAPIGIARNLPVILDELTGRERQEVFDMMHALSMGRQKIRLNTKGEIIKNIATWDSINFITSNDNVTELLYQFRGSNAQAAALRCFEIRLDDGIMQRVFNDISGKQDIERQIINENHGAAGQAYLQFLVRHTDEVRALLQRVRMDMDKQSTDRGRDRFYMDLIATAMTGGLIASKLGLISFDLAALKRWALAHVLDIRAGHDDLELTPEEMFARYVADLSGHIIVSQNLGDSRTKVEAVINPRAAPAARIAVKAQAAFISARHFQQWCTENDVSAREMREYLYKAGVFINAEGTGKRTALGRGTDCPTAQETVIHVKFDALLPSLASDERASVTAIGQAA